MKNRFLKSKLFIVNAIHSKRKCVAAETKK